MNVTIVGALAIVVMSPRNPFLRTDGNGSMLFKAGDELVVVHEFDSEIEALKALKQIGAKIDGGTTTVIIDDL